METKKELGEEVSGKDEVKFEAYDAQGNAHPVDVDEVCDYSPTTQGSAPEEEGFTGPVGPKPPSELGGSGKGSQKSGSEEGAGKGGRKGRTHRTWALLHHTRKDAGGGLQGIATSLGALVGVHREETRRKHGDASDSGGGESRQ